MKYLLPFLVVFELINVYPVYHNWLGPTWHVTIMKGHFKGTFWSKKLNWSVEGRSWAEEEYDSSTNTIKLGAARLGLRD